MAEDAKEKYKGLSREDLLKVIEKNGEWLINFEKDYNWEKCEGGDWGEWKEMEL